IIDILTEADESQRRQEEFRHRTQQFVKELDVDETLAQLLVTEGFADLEDVAYVDAAEFQEIEGFDEALVAELQRRAREALEAREKEAEAKRKELGVEDALAEIEGLTPAMLVTLGEAGIKTLDDLGDLAADELINPEDGILRDFEMTEDEANAVIMAARAHWFEGEDAEADGTEGSDS